MHYPFQRTNSSPWLRIRPGPGGCALRANERGQKDYLYKNGTINVSEQHPVKYKTDCSLFIAAKANLGLSNYNFGQVQLNAYENNLALTSMW